VAGSFHMITNVQIPLDEGISWIAKQTNKQTKPASLEHAAIQLVREAKTNTTRFDGFCA
jgi:hypothetical protein